MTNQLPLPSFFNPQNAGEWGYRANHRNLVTLAPEWRGDHGIKAAMTDRKTVTALIIDGQKDFLFPAVYDQQGNYESGGTLFVAGRSGRGAIDDTARTAAFIYRNLHHLTHVRATLDTHYAFQIFFASFWLTSDGRHPAPFTFIVAEESHIKPWMGSSVLVIDRGDVRVNPAVAGFLCKGNLGWLSQQARYYCQELHRMGKYDLYIWPEHCLLGDEGHTMSGVLQEARMFHAYVRGIQAESEVKGGNPLTENYSVLGPEVLTFFDRPSGIQKNNRFIQTLLSSDYVVIVGQAGSHCVAASTDDLLDEINKQDPALAKKVYVMTDCMSAVTVPNPAGGFFADFTPQMEAAFAKWQAAGMNLVKSTDDMSTWPGLDLG